MQIPFAFDYVYTPAGTDIFKYVHAALTIDENEKIIFALKFDEMPETSELKWILDTMTENRFKKMRLELFADCDVLLECNKELFTVKMQDGSFSINPVV